MRSESGEVFATPRGTLEAREYLRPVRTRVDGEWKDLDTTLRRATDGSVVPGAASVGLEFSGGGDSPLVRLTKGGRELALSWPAALPEPELEGSVATYRNVLPDVDLRMGAQEDGFTQLLVVKSAQAAASQQLTELRMRLAADGMEVRETAGGGLEAVDAGARGAVFEAPRPLMWDSSPGTSQAGSGTAARAGTPSQELPDRGGEEPGAGESGKLAPVAVEVPADGTELVLTPDTDVLRGSDTTYPVFIDPQWYSPRATAWTMASKYWASSPQWKFNGDSDSGLGYCDWSYCQPHDTKRLFYRIPVSKFAGKSIVSAEFVVRNTWSASCNARGVELWETKDISTSTTWNSQNATGFWIRELASKSFAYGFSGCSARDAEFNVKSAVQSAADDRDPVMVFGLRAASETDGYGWKRFSDKAHLRVEYNRPPGQLKMSQLAMEYGGVCKKPADAPRVRALGLIRALGVTDPDGDDVSVEFQVKGADGRTVWKPGRTGYKKSGSDFSIGMPSTIPKNEQLNWFARVHDGTHYSPWSSTGDPTACYFVYDPTAPASPSISSGDYPASDPSDPNDPWHDGMGQYGTFRFASSSTDTTTYWYGINTDPSPSKKITTAGGAAKTVEVLPPKPGLNFITAKALDAAGNASAPRTYFFRVKTGQPDRATWQLDEAAGATEAKGSAPARTLALRGGATPGATGVQNTALDLNGTDGYATTDLPAVDTSDGFAVSAWVKLAGMPTGAAVVATQSGNHSPGFELYYSKSYDRWAFNQYQSDTAGAPIVRAMAAQPGGVTAGTWTHLVGSYDAGRDVLELFVDGTLVGQTPYAAPWDARRGLQIGAGRYSGAPGNFLPGTVDNLRLFDKPLALNEVTALRAHQEVGDPGRPAIAVFDLDDPAGATEVAGHGGVLPAKYHGGVTTGEAGAAGKAARFDGTTGYARIGQTNGPHINTKRSFTVSAWVRPDRLPTTAGIIAAQAGHHAPGFELYYSSAYQRWAFNQYSADSPDATPIRAMGSTEAPLTVGQWVHLAGVHDTVANTLTLYVGGTKAGTTTLSSAFYANQSMYIGAGNYSGQMRSFFPGTIDDVRLLTRPLSAEEIEQIGKQRPLVEGRWNFETASTTQPVTTPDLSPRRRNMTLHGGAQLGSGWVDSNGLELNGTDAYASTSSMPIDSRGSFTVTAWAQASATPAHSVAVFSAEGNNRNAFEVRFHPDTQDPTGLGKWELSMPDQDTATASVKRVSNTEFYDVRDWNHLAVVYDGLAKELRLYVNGTVQDVACRDDDGDGTPDEAGCTDLTSWTDDALAFKANKSFQVGRAKGDTAGRYFPGLIDDVWTFQGPLNESQVSELAGMFYDIPTDVPAGH
ncbi:LamG-like jellyroll fold domain-containing protein [Streptomyces sp. NPDC049906]|uniref:LamG-like jellyroll fold domain-containing protein n=1 Tax=Streptomyces sp. NPDC049906 TaxID=3155656 RepID=UPI0034335F97